MLGAVVLLAAGADVAPAQVTIDPDSPSGKEYEIPLETVRRGAQPGADPSAPVTQGERSAAPFGEGISPARPDGSGSTAGGARGGARGAQSERSRDARRGEAQRGSSARRDAATSKIVEAAANSPGAPPSSTGSTLLYLGAGALVLALGVGGGVLLRRRRT